MNLLEAILDSIFDLNAVRGKAGESAIAHSLGWVNLFGFKGKLLRNVYIPKENGETSEIDLLYITKKGIFVIESKNYVGYIFGNEDSQKWTVTTYKGKDFFGRSKVNKYQFYNPMKQNKTHLKWLSNYIGDDIPLTSCIIFSNAGELKDITKESKNIYVFNRRDLGIMFLKVWNKLETVLNDEGIEKLYSKLEPLTLNNIGSEVKEKHISQINENKNICPKCGGQLVERKGKYGSFIGCSNYPKCKFTRSEQ